MRFSINGIFRFTVSGVCVSTVVAILLGRSLGPDSNTRTVRAASEVQINKDGLFAPTSDVMFIDPAGGTGVRVPLAVGDRIDHASTAPWRDANGRSQIVGRWFHYSGDGAQRTMSEFGLARHGFPEGNVINQVAIDQIPASPPCWIPGGPARVIYPACDGRLYHFAFEGSSDVTADSAGCDTKARPLQWAPGTAEAMRHCITDLALVPGAPGPLLFVAAARISDGGALSQLWWLQIDAQAFRVVAAGPIKNIGDAGVEGRRFPVVARSADGAMQLAHVARVKGQPFWQLRLNQVRFGIGTEPLVAVPLSDEVVAEELACSALAFGQDGRSIYYASATRPNAPGIRSAELLKALRPRLVARLNGL